MNPPRTFLWHDYETFGARPLFDRPAQFAAQRTSPELEPIGDPLVLYCAPANDVLPHPEACLITGITPQQALKRGIVETRFAEAILSEMSQPGTCSAGYNNIRFDDVITRSLLYRNFRDPYEREYKNGNSRWDLIDVTRMYYALRPDGIHWPLHEPGKPSFRLEDICAGNEIPHEGAHDALVDVRATIGLARLLKKAQPRLFAWTLGLRDQKLVAEMLDPTNPHPLLHTSSRIPADRGCTTLVLPLAVMPNRPKSVIVFDLMADPTPLIELPAETISDLVFTPAADLPEELERLPLKAIHGNHVPMIAPVTTLKGVDTGRIALDPDRCRDHAERVLATLARVRHKVIEVFSFPAPADGDSKDPDQMLYSGGFFSPADRHLMKKIVDIPPPQLGEHRWTFQDRRLPVMLFRYRARNFPETLTAKETVAWDQDRKKRLLESTDPDYFKLEDFRRAMKEARERERMHAERQQILDQLEAWVLESGIESLEET